MREGRYNFFIVLILVTLFAFSSVSAGNFLNSLFSHSGIEGSGELTTEERDVKSFDKIESSGSYDIYVQVGEEQNIEITYDDNLIDLIITRVSGKTLKISSEGTYSSRNTCRIDITVPELEKVYLSGSGDIEIVDLNETSFIFKLSGSGDLRASGKVEELEIRLSGSGDIDTRELMAKDTYCKVSGSGSIKVRAEEYFDGSVSGSGNIYYYGEPDHISTHVSGSGRIKKR